VRSFENIDEVNIEWLQSDACDVGFQHITDGHFQYCLETEARRRGWRE
jgi:hypothetical protein